MSEVKKTSNTKIVISGRASYANLFEPRAIEEGQDPKYSLSIMVPLKDQEQCRKIMRAVEAARQQGIKSCKKWGGEIPDDLTIRVIKKYDNPEKWKQKLKKNPEYKGMMVISASSKQRPGVVDENVEDILDKSKLQSGDYVNVEVNFFPYDRGSNGIGCGLNHVQFVKEGERFSARGSAQDAFQPIDSDSDEEIDDDIDDLLS